ncbi:hypothetical protein KAW18_10420 [candidate division WOR-3 bacterium]|nr:hypothetical protein [candidate division WOR-3 bacterium]
MKPKEFLYFYRVINWEKKISGVRPIGYTFLGYMMAGVFKPVPIFLNTIVISAALIFWYSINDYFDWKIQKERNYLGTKIEEGLSEKRILFYCFLPLLFLSPLFFIINRNNISSLLLLLIILLFTTFYSSPPFRFKQNKIVGIIIPPIGASILFLQAYCLSRNPGINIILLAILICLFQLYLETLHIMNDFLYEEETKKIKDLKNVSRLLRNLPLISLVVSLGFAIINPLFLITSAFSIVRFITIRRVTLKNIQRVRANFFSPIWSLYEFGIYGILGTLHLF